MTQNKANQIRIYIEEKGKTQDQASARFKIGKVKISYLKKCKWDVDIYEEYRKERNRQLNANRYTKKQDTTYDKVIKKLNKLGFKSYSDAISQMGIEPFRSQLRDWNIAKQKIKQGITK